MAIIFGASMATSKYAKSGNDPIAVEVLDVEDGQDTPNESGTKVNMSPNMGESANANAGESSHNKQPPRKKAKIEAKDEDPMLSTIKFGLERIAAALEKGAGGGDEIPEVKGRVEINKNFSYANSQDLAEVEGHEDYH
ncbi:hypothetical protein BRADI_3g37825v3 [Brachypodium distachyon]|uniref:Uncharacterized protein n=1 Tax=Brachypodium distachyon TaxID=15368 RepID=A0A2K2D1U5_BRADI|nr:hypothetical protein BRADI_3g37825v3 [Brachypodium distachyon]